MKKILLVGATLAALVALTIVVDRMSTKDGKPLVKAADTPAPAPEVTFKDLDGKDVTLATFHAFCESLIADAAPDRLMIDKVDHWILLRRNMARLQLDKYRRLADPGQFLNDFVEFFSRCQDELVTWEDYQRYAEDLAARLEAERTALDDDTYKERLEQAQKQLEIARAYRASEELLREKKRVSFGSLITGAVDLLEENTALRSALQEKFRYILVDEFQDTNIAQLRLLELLAGDRKNIFAVGDNDQAIYRFRGASFGSFQLFLERFANWKPGEDSMPYRVSLIENYRSSPNILRVATQVIAQNTVSADFPKKSLSANRKEGEKIRIAELEREEDEAAWVADELQRLHSAGRRWREFAVLYRQHAHRDELVSELSRRKIPFIISKLSILDHPLVKDVIAYLRLIATPFDDIACTRVLAAPAWHLEAPDLVRLESIASIRQRREEPDRSGSQHQGVMAGFFARAHFDAAFPRQTALNEIRLYDGFLRDRQRFQEHGDVFQIGGDEVHVFFVIHDIFRHVAVRPFNAALGEVSGETKILLHVRAGDAGAGRGRHHHRARRGPGSVDGAQPRSVGHGVSEPAG